MWDFKSNWDNLVPVFRTPWLFVPVRIGRNLLSRALIHTTAYCTEFEEQISLENFAFVAISGKIDQQTGALLRQDWDFSYNNPEDFDSGE